MMVDLGGGTRERFQSLNVEEHEGTLPPLSTVGYYAHTHTVPRSAPWRSTLMGQDASNRLTLLDSSSHNLIQIKSDPENLADLCTNSSSTGSMMALPGPPLSSVEAAEDAQARGQLLQEITCVAETFEPYSSPPTPPECYRNLTVSSDTQSHTDYIFSDTPQWCWNRSPSDEKGLSGHNNGSLFLGPGPSNETVINSLQYNVSSHLMSDAFSSPLPTVSVTESPISVPSCSPVQRPPPPPSTLTSSALDLSPGPPPMAHQLPTLQPTLLTPASPHTSLGSTPPSAHQLSALQSSLIALDVPSQTLSAHETIDDTLDLVGVEGPSHERMSEFECGECGAVFTRLSHLKYHMKLHTEVEKSVNKQDDFPQYSSNTKFRVQSPEKLFQCKHCDEKFSTAEKLKTHELKHSGDRPFRCNECGTSFPAKAMLIRHKKVHTGEKPYKCDICKTCFTEAGSLKVHKRLHSGEKPFKCDQCDVAFNGAGMLATHKRKHTGERPYMCDECGETFRLLSTLKSHRRRHTGEKPFVCELCGSSFTQRAAMQRHKRIHSDKKPWECDQCGYKFREKENLRKHIALHKIKLQHMCDICGAGFNQAKKLETHKMLHNGGDRPYQCNKCPSTFTNPKYLTQHKKRVHDRKGAIKCEECNGTFKRKETLRSHMRIHKGERPYVCEECGAAFNQRGTLTKHIRVHGSQVLVNDQSKDYETESNSSADKACGLQSPDKKKRENSAFSCSLCSLPFFSEKELIRHTRSGHPSQGSLQGNSGSEQDVDDGSEHIRDKYICEDCDQTFFRRRQLRAHKKFCPCRVPAYQTDAPEKVSAAAAQNDTKEVDAMKLLTAVLAVTSNSASETSGFQQPPSSDKQPTSTSSSTLCPTIESTTNEEEHHGRHGSLRLFSDCNPPYTEHLHIQFKGNHSERSPQQPAHLPHSSQRQHCLLRETSHYHQSSNPDSSLEQHLPQDQKNLAHHPSHIQSSDHHPSRILVTQSFELLQLSSRQASHLQQQPPQPDSDLQHQMLDHLEQPSKSSSNLHQGVSQQEHPQLIPRHYIHLHEPLKEHSETSHSSRLQDVPHQPTRLRTCISKEAQLHESHAPYHIHHSHLKQNHVHIQYHQIGHIVEEQFYKSPALTHPSQHLHHHNHNHHHLPQSEEQDENIHLPEFHQSLPDINDCDDFAHNLEQQCQEETDNCHCHPSTLQHQSQHLPQHYDKNNEQDDRIASLHHHQVQHSFNSNLGSPDYIKMENILS